MFKILAGTTFVVALVHASTFPQTQPNLRQRQSANGTIQWQPCTYGIAECALFTYVFHNPPSQIIIPANSVPLDYANPAAGTTQIAMIRYAAKTLPRKGSIFANPGLRLPVLTPASHSPLYRWSGPERRELVDGQCLYTPIHHWHRLGCPQFRSS